MFSSICRKEVALVGGWSCYRSLTGLGVLGVTGAITASLSSLLSSGVFSQDEFGLDGG